MNFFQNPRTPGKSHQKPPHRSLSKEKTKKGRYYHSTDTIRITLDRKRWAHKGRAEFQDLGVGVGVVGETMELIPDATLSPGSRNTLLVRAPDS